MITVLDATPGQEPQRRLAPAPMLNVPGFRRLQSSAVGHSVTPRRIDDAGKGCPGQLNGVRRGLAAFAQPIIRKALWRPSVVFWPPGQAHRQSFDVGYSLVTHLPYDAGLTTNGKVTRNTKKVCTDVLPDVLGVNGVERFIAF